MIKLILAALASHRLAILISKDLIPFGALRLEIGKKANKSRLAFYVSEGINCPRCTGMYTSLLFCWLVIQPKTLKEFFIYWLAIAGLQIELGGNIE